jgi:hypothetical protein
MWLRIVLVHSLPVISTWVGAYDAQPPPPFARRIANFTTALKSYNLTNSSGPYFPNSTSVLHSGDVVAVHSLPMHTSTLLPLLLSAARTLVRADGILAGITPHSSFGSSVGVLGCKVNTDRIAYWPMSVDCNNICVELSYGSRSVYLLRIDQSGGAYDVSYDAWNYLLSGKSATAGPIAGGATEMTYQNVDPSKCSSLINTKGDKLPLSASNSMNFVASCLAESDSWVAKNYVLYNIADSLCSWGYDETCSLDLTTSNQPQCPHTLGSQTVLKNNPVYNIEYPSGKKVLANQAGAGASSSSGRRQVSLHERGLALMIMMIGLHITV